MSGLIHVYYGDGKGKTTAAFGLALRALGHGNAVCVAQFIKRGNSGECMALSAYPHCKLFYNHPTEKFTFQMNDAELEVTKHACTALLEQVFACAHEEHASLLILDEAIGAMAAGVLEESAVLRYVSKESLAFDVILTGRNPSDAVLAICDYATRMQKKKHPYDKGIKARRGIEY